MPTLNAFASNKYRAICVPTSLVFDLTHDFRQVGQQQAPICIDTRQVWRVCVGVCRDLQR
jgi:hypothetical protein